MDLLNLFKNYLFSQADKPSKVTVKNYLSDVNHFVRWYETLFNKNFTPKEISSQTLSDYRTNCETVFSPSSLDRHFSSLRKFFKFLLIEGVISLDPFSVKKLNIEDNKDPWHVKEFKDFLYVGDASRLTIKNYLIDIKQFLAWAAQVTESGNVLSAIDANLVEEYKQRLLNQGDFSAATINRKLSSLRKYLAWASSKGIIESLELRVQNTELPQIEQPLIIPEPVAATSQPDRIRNYSPFPPIRLAQKASKGIIFALDNGLIIHLAKVVDRAEYALWKTQGQPVFTKINDLKDKVKVRQVVPNISHSILDVKNIKKEFYAPLEISTKLFPWYKKAWFTARYSRPKWYKTYHSYPIAHYLNFAVLIIFLGIISFSFYNVFFQKGNQSPTLAAGGTTPVAPPRVLSFQGRLTDNNDNPITTPTNLRFMIYNDLTASESAGKRLWEEVDNVAPDTDGIFNVILGNGAVCNSGNPPTSPATAACAIPQSLFADNAALWLGVTVGATPELTPRQPLATVAYATNAETLQGLVPTTSGPSAYTNTVLALDGTTSSPTLTIGGAVGATFKATGGQFQILGQSLLLGSIAGSGGNVQITPDNLGFIDLQRPLINSTNTGNIAGALGAVEIDDMLGIIATTPGTVITLNQNGTGNLFTASASGTPKFTITNSGGIALGTNLGTGLCLEGGSTASWGTCGGASFWQELTGALSPNQPGDDMLLGGSSTSTAKFAFTGLMGTQTQASFSGQLIVTPDKGYGGGIQLGSTINSNNVLNTLAAVGAPSGNLYWGNRQLIDSTTIGSYGVTSVTNSDGTLTISPTTGAVIASLNLTHPNSWTGAQTFTTDTNFPNGIWSAIGRVGIGSTAVGNAELIVNQPNAAGDIFSASTSGSTKFTITNSGGIALGTNLGAGLCLTGGTTASWGSCGTAGATTNFWQDLNGAISPLTASDDLLLGSSATTTAKFAFTGLMGANPQASFSGNFIVMPYTNGLNENGGNVGIGTTNPGGSLDVRGQGIISATTDTLNPNYDTLLIGQRPAADSYGSIRISPQNSAFRGYKLETYDNNTTANYFDIYDVTNSVDRLHINSIGNIGLGTANPMALLNINGGYGLNAALAVNQLNSGDLITASASGATKFTIGNDGTITSQAYLHDGGVLYTSTTGQVKQTIIGSAGQCLIGGTDPTWSSCATAAGGSFWQDINGAIGPLTSSNDLLLGSPTDSTASAIFAFTGLMGNQTQASISGNLVVMPNNGFGGMVSIGTTSAAETLSVLGINSLNELGVYDGTIANQNLLVADGGALTTKPTGFGEVINCTANANCTASGADGGTFADNTTEANTARGTAFSTWATSTAANTSVYLGLDHPFSSIYIDFSTVDVGSTVLNAQYWNGTAWTNLSGVSDGTAVMHNDGVISFTLPSDWTTKSINSSSNLYYVRLYGTTNATTAPTVYSISATSGVRLGIYAQKGDANPSLTVTDQGNVGIGTPSLTTINGTGTNTNKLFISGAAGDTGINISGITTGAQISLGSASNITTGSGISVAGTNASITSAFTGNYITIAPNRTLAAGATQITDSGSFLNVARNNTVNNVGDTYTISGDLVKLSSNCTVTSGVCADTSHILSLTQSLASASGSVLFINNSGLGMGAQINSNSGGQAAFAISDTGNGDLFTASLSATPKFTINNNGNIAATGTLTGLTGLTLASGPITLGGVTGTGLCINGGATATWGACGGTITQWWQDVNGAIFPLVTSDDLLLGSSATTTATFAFTGLMTNSISGVGGHQTQASFSGQFVVAPNFGYGGNITIKSLNSTNNSVQTGILFTSDNPPYYSSIQTYRGSLSTKIGLSFFTSNNAAPTEVMHLDPSGNLGLGNTNPATTLDVRNALGTSTIASVSGNLIVMPNGGWGGNVAIGYTDPGTADLAVNGNVGIGTTIPTGVLQITNNSGASQTTSSPLYIDNPKNTISMFLGHSENVTGYAVDDYAGDIRFNGLGVAWGDISYYPNSGTTDQGQFRFSVNGTTVGANPDAKVGVGSLYSASKVGIGTTTPLALLDVNGTASVSGALFFNRPNGTDANILALNGNNLDFSTSVGGGTGTIKAYFANNGDFYASDLHDIDNNTTDYYLDPAASGTSLNILGAIQTGGNITIGAGGTGKLTATTLDPVYTIDGTQYATYVPSMVGINEEVTGNASLTYNSDYRGYVYILNLNDQQTRNPNVWLWSRAVDPDITLTDVLLTPDSPAKVWYQKDAASRTVVFFADRPTDLSFRLTAPRFDHASWTNLSEAGSDITGLKAPDAQTATLSAILQQAALSAQITQLTDANGNQYYTLVDLLGNVIQSTQAFSDVVIANIQAGLVAAKKVTTDSLTVATDNITINGQNIHDYIASIVQNVLAGTNNNVISPIVVADQLQTGFISPVDNNASIGLKLDNNKLSVLNTNSASGSAVATIDNQGNASFSGQLTANSFNTQDATVSGTLHVGKIIADEIVGGSPSATYVTNNILNVYNSTTSGQTASSSGNFGLIANLATQNTNNQNGGNYMDISSYSGALAYVDNLGAANSVFSQNMTVLGQTTLSDTSVIGQLSVDGNLILANDSINVLGSDLNLQPLRQGGLSVMGGLFYIDTDGNIQVGGNADFAKNVTVHGNLATNIISPLPGNDLNLNTGNSNLKVTNASNAAVLNVDNLGNLVASGAGTFAKLNLNLIQPALAVSSTEVIATGSAGTATVGAFQTQVTIDNPSVTDKSLIYITPTSNTNNQVLYLQQQVPGTSFTVGLQTPSVNSIPFNWIIVN